MSTTKLAGSEFVDFGVFRIKHPDLNAICGFSFMITAIWSTASRSWLVATIVNAMKKKPIDRLEPFDTKGKYLNVIVETPKGSRVKYEYDMESGFFMLSKALPEGMVFPFNFGFVPKTLAADGDPLDVLILNEEPLISGCLLKVRLIAVIKATQTENARAIRNDRIIWQAISKETPLELQSLRLEKQTVSQIEFFFAAYNKLYGKKFKVLGTGGAHKARELVRRGAKLHRKKNKVQ